MKTMTRIAAAALLAGTAGAATANDQFTKAFGQACQEMKQTASADANRNVLVLVPVRTTDARSQTAGTQGIALDTRRDRPFQGRILDARTIDIAGAPEQHVVAKVRTNQGRTVVMDLGPVSNLRNQGARLNRGMPISGAGTAGRLAEKPVLIVYTFQTDEPRAIGVRNPRVTAMRRHAGTDVGMNTGANLRAMPEPRLTRQRAMRTQGTTVAMGELTDLRKVTLQGVPDAHHLVKLAGAGGQTIVADLGTATQIADLKLSKGDRVIVAGNAARINGKPVLFASHIAEVYTVPQKQRAERAPSRR